MQRQTDWNSSASGSQAASRKGEYQPTLRPLPCHAPIGTKSRESLSSSQYSLQAIPCCPYNDVAEKTSNSGSVPQTQSYGLKSQTLSMHQANDFLEF